MAIADLGDYELYLQIRWPNTVFGRTLANAIQRAQGLHTKTNKQRIKHAVDTAITLFARCPHYLCYFFSIIERSVLIVLVFYYKGMLEKVTCSACVLSQILAIE